MIYDTGAQLADALIDGCGGGAILEGLQQHLLLCIVQYRDPAAKGDKP